MGYRPQRIAELIHGELVPLLRSLKDPRVGMVSIMHVWVSGDLRICRVTVSPLGGSGNENDLMAGLRHASGWLRRQLARKLQLRHTPSLEFKLDDQLDDAIRMTSILTRMEEERSSREGEE